MRLRMPGLVFCVCVVLCAVVLRAAPLRDPGTCPRDSKLVNDGPTAVYGEGPGTWWGLIVDGMIAAGLDTTDKQITYLNSVFGTNFDNLDDLKALNLQQVSGTWDKNQNGFVCAFDLRGTRAYIDDPYKSYTYFGVSDDKIRK